MPNLKIRYGKGVDFIYFNVPKSCTWTMRWVKERKLTHLSFPFYTVRSFLSIQVAPSSSAVRSFPIFPISRVVPSMLNRSFLPCKVGRSFPLTPVVPSLFHDRSFRFYMIVPSFWSQPFLPYFESFLPYGVVGLSFPQLPVVPSLFNEALFP